MRKLNKTLYILLMLVMHGQLHAQQGLTLFQSTENQDDKQVNNRRPQRASQTNTEPAFTLIGTSRFGNEYYASLLHRDGTEVLVNWKNGVVEDIKGYAGYKLAQVVSRKVTLTVPESEPCVTNSDKGVNCNGNYAVLSLSNAAPLQRQATIQRNNSNTTGTTEGNQGSNEGNESEPTLVHPETGQPIVGPPGQQTIGNTGVAFRNPFSGEIQTAEELTPEELAAREKARQQRTENFRNFEIVRIPDDEIPEGMQRIRTPFGDRLEPAED